MRTHQWIARRRWLTGLVVPLFMLSPLRQSGAQEASSSDDTWESAPPGGDQGPDTEQPPATAVPQPQSLPGGTSASSDEDPRALSQFRADLDPYGSWVDDPTYGTVWMPRVPADFGPYSTAGHWNLDTAGNWQWVSDYPWGNVTFHYGRWVWLAGAGWGWIPGYQYAPAWVVWSVGEGSSWDYVGWAPAPPSFCWYGGWPVWFAAPAPRWFFYAPRHYVFHHDLPRYMIRDRSMGVRIAAHSRMLDRPVPIRTGRGTVLIGRTYPEHLRSVARPSMVPRGTAFPTIAGRPGYSAVRAAPVARPAAFGPRTTFAPRPTFSAPAARPAPIAAPRPMASPPSRVYSRSGNMMARPSFRAMPSGGGFRGGGGGFRGGGGGRR